MTFTLNIARCLVRLQSLVKNIKLIYIYIYIYIYMSVCMCVFMNVFACALA